MPVKSRTFSQSTNTGEYSEDGGKTWKGPGKPTSNVMGTQTTESVNHHRLPNGSWDGGGPFTSVRIERSFPTTNLNWRGSGSFKSYALRNWRVGTPCENNLMPLGYGNKTIKELKKEHSSSLDSDGATAISLCAPTNPNAELGVAVSEMYREGLPSLPGIRTWKHRTGVARAAAGEFLNAEFGWLPLVSDITNTANSVRHSRDILHQYHRDSGSNVRREFSFPVDNSVTVFDIGAAKPSVGPRGFTEMPGFVNVTSGFGAMNRSQTLTIESRKWFSGCFTYTVPSQSDSWHGIERNAADADKLFGISLTPDIVWELTPWSWAVDWFTNTGDVIHNINNFAIQGLVMRYGYMMEESIVTIDVRFTGPKSGVDSSSWPATPPQTLKLTSKRRVPANPFGFGVTTSGLSATQVAIAAALGILLV